MTRIPLRKVSEVGVVTRRLYQLMRRRFGQVPEPAMVYAHHPGLLRAWAVHEGMVEKASKELPAELRDLVVHRVATVVGCSWCVDFGTMLAIKAGFSVERHRDLARYASSPVFTADEKLALEYADAMTAQPMTVTDELVERLRERFSDAQLIELTYQVALENFRARSNHALGITAQGYTEGDACPLPIGAQISAAAGSVSPG